MQEFRILGFAGKLGVGILHGHLVFGGEMISGY